MTPEFDLVNNMFGWGDPGSSQTRGIWFVGIEEFDGLNTAEQVREFFKDKKISNNFVVEEMKSSDQKFKGGVANYTSKIVCMFSPEVQRTFPEPLTTNPLSWQQEQIWKYYRDRLLWYPGTGVCNANLFPLGKNKVSESLPEGYETLYGFGPKSMEQYEQHVRNTRFPKMRERWEQCRPQATICYVGDSRRKEVEKLFWHRLAEDPITPVWENLAQGVLCNKERRILITPHFTIRMSDPTAKFIVEQLKAWDVKLPK
jgi:hypothetical protein